VLLNDSLLGIRSAWLAAEPADRQRCPPSSTREFPPDHCSTQGLALVALLEPNPFCDCLSCGGCTLLDTLSSTRLELPPPFHLPTHRHHQQQRGAPQRSPRWPRKRMWDNRGPLPADYPTWWIHKMLLGLQSIELTTETSEPSSQLGGLVVGSGSLTRIRVR
jgi:hypothetical protein